MTKSQWLSSTDPNIILKFMTERNKHVGHPGMPFISNRKLRLFASNCSIQCHGFEHATSVKGGYGVWYEN